MFQYPLCYSEVLPEEYRAAAEGLFPPGGFSDGKLRVEAAEAFADILGIGEDFRHLVSGEAKGQAAHLFLERFQNNLDLLIQKTWVEKDEEARKENLLDSIPHLVEAVEKGDYSQALEEFGPILRELAYLFFGEQSLKDDFGEYVLRIDDQIGLFWWYGGQVNAVRSASWVKTAERKSLAALLLLGICYLTNF